MTKSFFAGLAFAAFFLSSCEEEPLPIVMEEPLAPLQDTTYVNNSVSAAQDKKVLFEDFTGVRCPTCPVGHQAIKDMQDKYPEKIIAIAIHPGAVQFPQAGAYKGEQDLNTEFGAKIFTIIPKPLGIPYGIADRLNGAGNNTPWESLCTPRLSLTPEANVEVKVLNYDPVTRELRYEVKFEVLNDLNEGLFFSTAITESDIEQTQEYPLPTGEVHDYIHNHVLRDMPQFSEPLNPNNVPAAEKGRVFVKQYSYTLPDLWVAHNCHLVGYIHRSVEIMQAAEVEIK